MNSTQNQKWENAEIFQRELDELLSRYLRILKEIIKKNK